MGNVNLLINSYNVKYLNPSSCIATMCIFGNFICVLQILDPRTAMTFLDHSPLTKAAHLTSMKASTATL